VIATKYEKILLINEVIFVNLYRLSLETAGDSTQMNNAKEGLSLGPYLRDGHSPMLVGPTKYCTKYRIKIITCM
jgi:hypothetical protein